MPQLRCRAQRPVLLAMWPACRAAASDDARAVGDAHDELVGWDGKFARTIRLLLTRPGELTAAVIEGQRARTSARCACTDVQCRVLSSPGDGALARCGQGLRDWLRRERRRDDRSDTGRGSPWQGGHEGLAALTSTERAALDREIDAQPWLIRPMIRAMAEDYDGVMRRAEEAIPRVLFVLIPALALVLAGLLSRPALPRAPVLRRTSAHSSSWC